MAEQSKTIVPLAVYNNWSALFKMIADEFIAEGKWALEKPSGSSA